MELADDDVRVIRQFHHFDVGAGWRGTGDAQAGRGQLLFVLAVELVTVAMALADFSFAVNPVSKRVGLDLAGPRAKSHRPAQFFDSAQLAQLINDAVRRRRIELA